MSAPGWYVNIDRCVIRWGYQPFITATRTLYFDNFSMIIIRVRSSFKREIKAGMTKRVLRDYPIPNCGLKNVGGFFDGVSSLARGYQDANTAWILFFF